MGSSAKTGKKFFRGSPEHFLDKNDIWDRTPPPIHQLQSTCVGEGSRVPNFQTEFNYLDSFKSSKAFLVILLSLWSPCCPHVIPIIPTSSSCRPRHPHIVPIAPRRSPCGPHGCGLRFLRGLQPMLSPWSPCCPDCPHIVPVIPTSSPHHPCHPHIVPIAPRRSSCGPHGCGLHCLRGLHPMLSPWSPCCPCCPHVIPVIPTSSPSSPHHPHSPQKVPRRSPWLWSPLSPWSPPYVVPMVPMLSPCHPHVIPVSSPLSPHCLKGPHIIPIPPDTHSTHPHPPGGVGGPESVKML